jgi:hypothetical protein
MAAGVSLDQVHRVIATAVDTTFYRAVYRDLGEDDPVAHYASRGWREGRDPAPWFSTSEYLRLHEDVARADVNPLYHFLTGGRREGRDVPGSIHARAYRQARRGRDPVWAAESPRLPARSAGRKRVPRSVAPVVLDADSLLVATAFDRSYYAALNEDVASGGQDPLTHFMTFGWREGRDPNARFSVEDYLENYPDVAAAGVNPFLHYLRAGRSEGRTPRNDLGFRHGVIAGLKPLDRRIADVKACKDGDLGDLACTICISVSAMTTMRRTPAACSFASSVKTPRWRPRAAITCTSTPRSPGLSCAQALSPAGWAWSGTAVRSGSTRRRLSRRRCAKSRVPPSGAASRSTACLGTAPMR